MKKLPKGSFFIYPIFYNLAYTKGMAQPLEWGTKRKVLIKSILGFAGVMIVGFALFVIFYRAPTCTDGKKDGSEIGVDCGLSCPYACASQENAPRINFVRVVSPQPGRTDLIAYLSNTNSNAGAEAIPYTVMLYSPQNTILARKTGTITLPPNSTVPLFVHDLYDGSAVVGKPRLSFDTNSIKWLKNVSQPILPTPSNIQIQASISPRITATLTNSTSYPIYGQVEVVTVFNAKNSPIAASETVVSELTPEGTAPVVFTWNEAFPDKAVRAEILPTFVSNGS